MSKEAFGAKGGGYFLVLCVFCAIVQGKASSGLWWEVLQPGDDGVFGFHGTFTFYFCDEEHTAFTLCQAV